MVTTQRDGYSEHESAGEDDEEDGKDEDEDDAMARKRTHDETLLSPSPKHK